MGDTKFNICKQPSNVAGGTTAADVLKALVTGLESNSVLTVTQLASVPTMAAGTCKKLELPNKVPPYPSSKEHGNPLGPDTEKDRQEAMGNSSLLDQKGAYPNPDG